MQFNSINSKPKRARYSYRNVYSCFTFTLVGLKDVILADPKIIPLKGKILQFSGVIVQLLNTYPATRLLDQ